MFILEDIQYIAGCSVDIPTIVGKLVSLVYMVIRIGIPIILLIVGMVDLGKAVVAQKDDEIKKAQSLLIKKVIAAVLVFLLFTLIQFAIGLVTNKTDVSTTNMWNCVNAILNYSDTGNAKASAKSQTDCDTAKGSWDSTTNICS